MLRHGLAVLLAGSFLALAGCRSAPVLNVADAPVAGTKSLQQVEQAIVEAGQSLGWRMQPQGPGHVQGTLLLRDHRAVVDVSYTAKAYSIRYKDSANLHYDGSSIHKNYNGWIQNLDRAISNRLSS
jgi:hypothetical protein